MGLEAGRAMDIPQEIAKQAEQFPPAM